MADDAIDKTAKKVVGIGGGAIVGGLVVAPVVVGTLAALGFVFPPLWPVAGALAVAGMWAGHKWSQD